MEANFAPAALDSENGRGHALTVGHGWREVAATALAFIKRVV